MESRSRWSWKLGTLFGIAIRVHVTLLALLAWIVVASPLHRGSLQMGLVEIATVLAVFAIIVLHELAHALVARRFGSRTRDILLLPIGGIANIDKMPTRPNQELLVAAAGPTLNITLAFVIATLLAIAGADFWPGPAGDLQTFGARLLWINLSLAVFNLIPAYPMDGGRMLRAMLAMWIGLAKATRIAAKVALAIAVAFVVFGIVYNPILALIGFFVWTLARQELATVTVRERLRGAVAADAMIRALDPVDPDDDPYRVAERMLADGVRLLPVIEGQRVLGIVTAHGIMRRLHGSDPHDVIRGVTREVPVVTSDTPLVKVVDALDNAEAVIVVDDGALMGLLTVEQIEMFGELVEEPGFAVFPRPAEVR
ncbi:MAG: site-2 protease family protein [Kofleriaceae bacterium]